MEIFHSLLAIVLLVSRCAGDDGKVIAASQSARDDQWTCPDPDVIFPCVCDEGNLDCSDVESEDQLAQIMGSSFSNPNFRRLFIKQNHKLRVLRAGDLGNTTYTEIFIQNSTLERVESGALFGSTSTLSEIVLAYDNLPSFPWDDLSSFTQLTSFYIPGNSVSGFSNLTSSTLTFLDLSNNPLGSVEVRAFSGLPSLLWVNLQDTGLTNIIPGTFDGLPKFCSVSLDHNHLVYLSEGAITVSNCSFGFVDLSKNNITIVAVNAINGFPLGGDVLLFDNHLTRIEEEVWRPLLQNSVNLFLDGNPLFCGCDIAWLFREPSLLRRIDPSTKCGSGELLVDLDPAIFDQC